MKRISVVLPVIHLDDKPFLAAMSEFCIKTLRLHADNPFELVVVEAVGGYFSLPRSDYEIDQYLHFDPKIGGVKEINAGIRASRGEFIVTAGNDVIVPPHWDTELLRCFEERADCGIAALSAAEPGCFIGPPSKVDMLVEGMYSPFNMFRRGWEYDEAYQRIYQDSDLVMRIYEAGLRSYRSCRAMVHHLLRMTNDNVDTVEHNRLIGPDEKLFYQRWENSPLAAFAMIRAGQYVYGREFESWLRPIQRHG